MKRMSSSNMEQLTQQEVAHDDQVAVDHGGDQSMEDAKDLDKGGENSMPTPEQEEAAVRKKYGGMLPKKKPLIAKDHERAFFDSADWALNKQGGQKPKGPLEALRPKLQPNPQHQSRSRRSAYAPSDDGDGEGGNNQGSSEDESSAQDATGVQNDAPDDQSGRH